MRLPRERISVMACVTMPVPQPLSWTMDPGERGVLVTILRAIWRVTSPMSSPISFGEKGIDCLGMKGGILFGFEVE